MPTSSLAAKAAGAPSARERLLAAAAALFYRDGVTATGIDSIVKRAGVAKKSLYNNFASKSDLVAAYLEVRHAEWLALYAARLDTARCSRERVMAVFLAYEDHASQAYEHGFRGCGLLNAAAELPAGDAGRAVVSAHKAQVEALLAEHLAAGSTDSGEAPEIARAERLARHLAFVLEGAMTRAGLEGNSDALHQARTIASTLMEAP